MSTMTDLSPSRRHWTTWLTLAVCAAGLLVVLWVALSEWGGVVHGHPAYAVLLGVTSAASILVAALTLRGREPRRSAVRLVGRIAVTVLAIAWIALIAWLKPHTAVEPALAAMESNSALTVVESATDIVLEPSAGGSAPGVFFQPGALVDARAYAAVLRPLAEAGHTVVIAKQPLGIGFLGLGAFDGARTQHPEVTSWVVGGHSLGGTVAAVEATADGATDVSGLLLFASYPATDISDANLSVASISGTEDGLSTPAKIEESRANLPGDTLFVVIDGASHAQFGSYGLQAGDGSPTISNEDARQQIADASVEFVASLE
jgi:hypothetical protein